MHSVGRFFFGYLVGSLAHTKKIGLLAEGQFENLVVFSTLKKKRKSECQ